MDVLMGIVCRSIKQLGEFFNFFLVLNEMGLYFRSVMLAIL